MTDRNARQNIKRLDGAVFDYRISCMKELSALRQEMNEKLDALLEHQGLRLEKQPERWRIVEKGKEK